MERKKEERGTGLRRFINFVLSFFCIRWEGGESDNGDASKY